ncbi:MAG TPA: helix-turn-helix transcriptional regulator [Thermoanaerobaculia bacterium]|jgi:transcriptional regulator with XRE-family HTH domain
MPRTLTYSPDADRFGEVVRQHRKRLGWTKKKLAQRAGLTPQYVGIVEEGGNVPSLDTVLELLEVLGADTGEVMRYLAEERRKPAKQ